VIDSTFIAATPNVDPQPNQHDWWERYIASESSNRIAIQNYDFGAQLAKVGNDRIVGARAVFLWCLWTLGHAVCCVAPAALRLLRVHGRWKARLRFGASRR
jgi:hypothetical protein